MSLKDKIREEMIVDYSNALEKNYELAKQLFNITQEGKIDIIDKHKYTVKEKILLYLIGKLYAKEAELSETEEVSNKELQEEAGISQTSVTTYTKELRDESKISTRTEGGSSLHKVKPSIIEKALKEVMSKKEND